jgi:hypothetical protein
MKRTAAGACFVFAWIVLGFALSARGFQQKATIQGSIVELATGQPVPAAVLILSGDGGYFRVNSDREGRFVVTDMVPGEYKVDITREGYYWSKSRSGPPTITIKGDLRNVSYRLLKGLVISGQILDPNGDPDSGISVVVQRLEYRNGVRTLARVNPLLGTRTATSTDRKGEYRLYGFEPGDYYLAAGNGDTLTYYPGTADFSAAVPLRLVPGRDLLGVNMTQVRSRMFTVTVEVPQALDSLSIPGGSILPRDPLNVQQAMTLRSIGRNRYTSSPLRPGEYYLTWANRSPRLFGRVAFDIVDHDADVGPIVLHPGITISGRVRVSDPRLESRGIPLQLIPLDGSVGGLVATSAADGSFSIRDVPDGEYWLELPRLREASRDAYLESVRYAARTPERGDIVVGREPEGPLDIVIGIGNTVSGIVRNARAEVVPYSPVLIYPLTGHPRLLRTGETNKDGAFTITGVGAGEYRGLAWEDALPTLHRDPTFLDTLNPHATAVTVRSGVPANVELRVVPVNP